MIVELQYPPLCVFDRSEAMRVRVARGFVVECDAVAVRIRYPRQQPYVGGFRVAFALERDDSKPVTNAVAGGVDIRLRRVRLFK